MRNKKLLNILVFACLMFTESALFAENDIIVSKEDAEIVKKIADTPQDANSMPSFMKGLTAEYIPQSVKLGRSDEDTDENILEIAKKNKPQNYTDFAKILCPSIIKETKKPKNITVPSVKELAEKPPLPSFKILRRTIYWWAQYVRLLQEEDKNDNAALVVAYAGYYVARDLEESYSGSKNMISKSIGIALTGIASKELLRWAEKPRDKSVKLAKYLAKDLLELVKNDYPFSSCMDFEKACVYSVFYESGKKDEQTKAFADVMIKSDYLNKMMNLFYIEPKSFIDKPLYLCKEEIERYVKKVDDAGNKIQDDIDALQKLAEEAQNSNGSFDESKIDRELIKRATIGQILNMAVPNIAHLKSKYEEKLTKMEIVAISLAYNSYYCENKKVPESIEELEKWFGEKLPVNRLTGKPYVFNSEKGYVLYNLGLDGKKYDGGKNDNDDISFKFLAN